MHKSVDKLRKSHHLVKAMHKPVLLAATVGLNRNATPRRNTGAAIATSVERSG